MNKKVLQKLENIVSKINDFILEAFEENENVFKSLASTKDKDEILNEIGLSYSKEAYALTISNKKNSGFIRISPELIDDMLYISRNYKSSKNIEGEAKLKKFRIKLIKTIANPNFLSKDEIYFVDYDSLTSDEKLEVEAVAEDILFEFCDTNSLDALEDYLDDDFKDCNA